MPDANTATRIEVPNYAGLLYQKGDASTPLLTLLGVPKVVDHAEFATGVYYDAPVGEQPAITENASLTAPQNPPAKRKQITNVTQIFQYSINVSYAKESDMGTLSGMNAANQVANPPSELDFQIMQKLNKARADMEYSFMRGTYNKATSADEANKTRGLIEAITTNVIPVGATEDAAVALTYWKVVEALSAIKQQGGQTDGLVLALSAPAMLQLNKDVSHNMYMAGVVTIAGLNLQQLVTPFGQISMLAIPSLNKKGVEKANTAVLFNPSVMATVTQPVPDKGNFFVEELAKQGAGTRLQLFGQAGLDHGPEYMAAKLTNISNDAPTGTL